MSVDQLLDMLQASLSFAAVAADPTVFYGDEEVAQQIHEDERDDETLMTAVEVSRAQLYAGRAMLDDLERRVFDLIDEGLRLGEIDRRRVADLSQHMDTREGLEWVREWLVAVASAPRHGDWIAAADLRQ